MFNRRYQKILQLVTAAVSLAKSAGINNLLQPGLIKEMIIANALGHELITSKRGADAHAPDDPETVYEYLSCKEGGSGQMDRMFSRPADKKAESLSRISRNNMIYLAIFHANNQIELKTIYAIEPDVLLKETEKQLTVSKNAISHIGISENWAKRNGTVVYPKSD